MFGWSISAMLNEIGQRGQQRAMQEMLIYEARRQEAEARRLAEQEMRIAQERIFNRKTVTVEYTRLK